MPRSRPFAGMVAKRAGSRIRPATLARVFILVTLLASLVGGPASGVQAATAITFTGEELLGKPTDTSITINIVPASTIEYHYRYGTTSGDYDYQTGNYTAAANQPSEVVIGGLNPNTQYYYLMRYHLPGETDWVVRPEYSFWTQRAPGSTFVFTVTSDSHATFNTAHQQAMQNIKNEDPDFEVDLGDTFYIDTAASQATANAAYLRYREPEYLGAIGPSVPIFLASGNHEDEEGWNLDDTPFSTGIASIQARKAFFPAPIDDDFYTGNEDPLARIDESVYSDELREDYYAWEWGDALFVVIDEFQYTMSLPYAPGAAGEGTDDPMNGDQWSWTLGQQQYNWLKDTLEDSDAIYKFVFSHNMLGGIPNLTVAGVGPGYVRGGAGAAPYFEWGGKNADGSEGFEAHRPGWGGVPIHQLFVDNGVSAYFHGHDHQYVYEELDGIVYQEVPSPSMTWGFSGIYDEDDDYTIKMLPSTGHLRITVSPQEATVTYVRSGTGDPYTYTIEPNGVTPATHTIVATAGDNGSIGPSGSVVVAEGHDRSFTITPAGGYQVADVLVDDVSVGAVTSYVFTNVTANHTIAASFEAASGITYTLTTSVSPSGGGTTTPAAGPHTYPAGAGDTVTADPATGYRFDHWEGACTGSGTCQVTMDEDKSVTAYFTRITHVLTVAADPTAGGTTTPAVGSHAYTEGTPVNITATAAAGYEFANWSGACTGTDPCSVIMDSDKSVTAIFAPKLGMLGDVNGDGVANSTDALIVLSCDAGLDTSQFCPMNCGDVNGDGLVNSTDALIILSYDAGMSVPFGVGQSGCPSSVTPGPGCSP